MRNIFWDRKLLYKSGLHGISHINETALAVLYRARFSWKSIRRNRKALRLDGHVHKAHVSA